MKNSLLTLFAFFLFVGFSQAQIQTPAPSPASKVEQKIGLTDVVVEYSRPGKKGRDLFGNDALVEYGKLWRTGANAATKITFSEDVTINGNKLAKGSYALLTKPGANSWMLNFYTYDGWSWSSYVEKEADLTVEAKTKNSSYTFETFTIGFGDFSNDSGVMSLMWGNTIVPVAIGVETDKVVMESIEKVMAGPSNNDYYNAASYFHSSGKDLEQALEWIQKATKVDNPKFWQVRRESLILADLGRTKEAIEAAKKSKSLAEEAGNADYVKMNEQSIKEWMAKK